MELPSNVKVCENYAVKLLVKHIHILSFDTQHELDIVLVSTVEEALLETFQGGLIPTSKL